MLTRITNGIRFEDVWLNEENIKRDRMFLICLFLYHYICRTSAVHLPRAYDVSCTTEYLYNILIIIILVHVVETRFIIIL